MTEVVNIFKTFSDSFTWQITVLVIIFLLRKNMGTVLLGLSSLIKRTTKLIVNGKSITLEAAAEIIEKQNEEIQEKETLIEVKEKEIDDYTSGGFQLKTKDLITNDIKKMQKIGNEFLPNTPDDPQKNKWGGQSEKNGKRLSAEINEIKDNPYFFKIILTVSSVNKSIPIKGIIRFHLHPTFNPPIREVVPQHGIAKLHLIAYGAFTVGVEVENVKLELDLSNIESAPELFKKS